MRPHLLIFVGRAKISGYPFSMRIAIGSDHAGFRYKQEIITHLGNNGHEVEAFGTDSEAPVSYVTFVRPDAEAVAAGEYEHGIVLGGVGNGEAITVNRTPGIRCGICWNLESARLTRLHNDANVVSVGGRMMDLEAVPAIVDFFLTFGSGRGRHLERICQINQ